MNKEIQKTDIKETKPVSEVAEVVSSTNLPKASLPARNNFPSREERGGMRKRNPRKPMREPRAKPEFDQKIINIRRVARVTSGGRRFNFSVAIIAGDRKGRVGVGIGKGADTALSIDKALKNAKKNMVTIHLTKDMSIPHEVQAKYSSARVVLRPAKGRGVVAGSALRDVIFLAGIKDIGGKILSPSKNKLNVARATVEALKQITFVSNPKLKVEDKKETIKK